MKGYAKMDPEKLRTELAKLTNMELYEIYKEVQDYMLVMALANETMNRWAWYMHKRDLPEHDTANETYKNFKE